MTDRIDLVALRRVAEQHADLTDPSDPYPAELVGQLARGILELDRQLDEMGTWSIQNHAEYKERRNAQFAAYELAHRATIAFLLDRAEQYDNSSGYRACIDELVQGIAEWRHVQCAEAGEYDDMKGRIDRIVRRTKP